MKLKIGNDEAQQLRERIAVLGLTQKQLAEKIAVSERYMRDILSTHKTKAIGVDREKVEDMLSVLGIGWNHIFPQVSGTGNHPHLENYIKTLKSKMYNLLSKDSPEETRHNKQLAQYLQEDTALNKTMGFWYTLIVKTIADKYKVMRHFFDKNEFFAVVPTTGYWRKFQHDAGQQKNCYFSFKLLPKVKNSTFHIAYTLESPLDIGNVIPKKIKIVYGKIEQQPDCIRVTQYHDTPASYRIKPMADIIVTTWLDGVNHDFIIMSDDDFELQIANPDEPNAYPLGVKSKAEVKALFHELGTALFPRNHIFHREGKHDMGDDPIFFWSNAQFIAFNQALITSNE